MRFALALDFLFPLCEICLSSCMQEGFGLVLRSTHLPWYEPSALSHRLSENIPFQFLENAIPPWLDVSTCFS